MSPDENRPPLALYLAVAFISASALGLEVTLTRVFSVLLRYQFTFLVISLALCGLGLGSLWAHFAARRGHAVKPELAALTFAVSTAISLLLILRVVFAIRPDQFWVGALLVLVPFGAAGAFLSEVFRTYPRQGSRLYGWDLAGAALAALCSVGVMQFCGAVDACLLFGALGGIAALYSRPRPSPGLYAVALCIVALWPINQSTHLWSVQPIPPMPDKDGYTLADRGITQPLFTELGDSRSTSHIQDTRWNAFARTDVVNDSLDPNSKLLYTNGNVPTNMMAWDGNDWTLPGVVHGFALSDWTFHAANIKDSDVLSIGPGGGLDALLSLRYGARRFDGAEINPSIVGLMKEPRYAGYNGHVYSNPKVHVVTAEGRAFVKRQEAQGKHYKLLFSALTKTATAGQGMALLESFIYTQDAFHDYLNAIGPDGTVAIVGDAPGNFPLLLGRLLATALTELKARGLSQKEAGRCLAIVYSPQPGPYQWALLIRKTPFPFKSTFAMEDSALKASLEPWWIPDQAAVNSPFPFGDLCSGKMPLSKFLATARGQGFDFAACSDNSPYVLDLSLSPFSVFYSSPSLTALLGLAVLGTLLLAAGSLSAAGEHEKPLDLSAWRPVLYFLLLGVGFMLIEIPLIEKLILPLGYPTLALTVILFALLLGGGTGALFSQRFEGEALRQHAIRCAVGVLLLAVVFALISSSLGHMLLTMELPARCALTLAVLLPLGFLMGTPFPSGLRLFAAQHQNREAVVPLMWALNGTASVIGSIGAAVGAKAGGFSSVLLTGAVIYLVAAVLLMQKTVRPAP